VPPASAGSSTVVDVCRNALRQFCYRVVRPDCSGAMKNKEIDMT
jgi:hypothetical protein